MSKTKKILVGGLASLLLVMLIGIAFAYQGNPSITGPNYSTQRHEAMTAAFLDKDYAAWFALMTETGKNPRVLSVVNENNFSTFVEAHNALVSGDLVKANELRTELGLNNGNGPKNGTGFMKNQNKNGSGQRRNQHRV